MIDKILSDQATTHTNEISISWGFCENEYSFAPSSEMQAADAEFQLAQAAGISVFAASGDYGSTDCGPSTFDVTVDYPGFVAVRDRRRRHDAPYEPFG